MSSLLSSTILAIDNAGQASDFVADNNDETPPVNVLVVDDHLISQIVLSRLLSRKNIRHDIANNGAEAVDMCQTGCFDIVLMDTKMPVMDGIRATREIRRLESSEGGTASSPAIIIIALLLPFGPVSDLDDHGSNKEVAEAMAAGCNDFMIKPVSFVRLHDKIVKWGLRSV